MDNAEALPADPRGPVAVRIAQLPETRQEIYALERACLKAAKQSGYSGGKAKTEAARIYNAAIEEAQRAVREPETQQTIVQAPEANLATRVAPKGMTQLDSGLYVPKGA